MASKREAVVIKREELLRRVRGVKPQKKPKSNLVERDLEDEIRTKRENRVNTNGVKKA